VDVSGCRVGVCLGFLIGLAGQGSVRGHRLGVAAGECPGFVVVLAGLQAVVQHSDAAVGEVAGGGGVAVAAFAASGEVGVRGW
jgi:hypothetical protein